MIPRPTLTRFEILVLRNRSTSDTVQVPSDSLVEFYLQGASIREDPPPAPVSGGTTIDVWHVGQIQVGDKLWRNGKVDAAPGSNYPELQVTAVDTTNSTNPTISVSFTSTLTWQKYDRLVLAVPAQGHPPRPSVYANPLGLAPPIGTSIQTFAAEGGRASCYVPAFRFDYTVNITGEVLRVYPDAAGSFVMRG